MTIETYQVPQVPPATVSHVEHLSSSFHSHQPAHDLTALLFKVGVLSDKGTLLIRIEQPDW